MGLGPEAGGEAVVGAVADNEALGDAPPAVCGKDQMRQLEILAVGDG